MIILDTNVLSELMRPRPDASVLRWLGQREPASLYVTSLSYAEMLFGVALLPQSKRRDLIGNRLSIMFDARFEGRVLAFDQEAAPAYASIASDRQRAGKRIGPMDGLIAAIALTHNAAIATRDRGFSGCGITVIDPWTVA